MHLAYHLLHIIEYRLRAKGDRRSWPTIRDIMRNHERVTISFNVLDDNGEAKKHFIRLNTTLELDQLTIYRNLNLTPIPLSRKHLASKGVVTTKMDNS